MLYNNRSILHSLLPVLLLAAGVITGCQNTDDNIVQPSPGSGSGINVADHIAHFKSQISVEAGQYVMKDGYSTHSCEHHYDVYIDLLPFYVYGDNSYSGDYYVVEGYIVAHNTELGSNKCDEKKDNAGGYYCWDPAYLKKLSMAFSLLDKDGCTINTDDAEFYQAPQPQTTIGSTTYTTGCDFTLKYSITFGLKSDTVVSSDFKFAFPIIIPSLKFKDDEKRKISDQSIEHNVDFATQSVKYDLITNNDDDFQNLPEHTKTAQTFCFSWVWHLRKGHRSACDYSKDGMKLRCVLNPQYRLKWGYRNIGRHRVNDHDNTYYTSTPESQRSVTFDLPIPNRTPIGTLKFRNTTSNYVANITLTKEGVNGQKETDYLLESKEDFAMSLTEGKYSINYDIIHGNSGATMGQYTIPDIVIKSGSTFETSTLNGIPKGE